MSTQDATPPASGPARKTRAEQQAMTLRAVAAWLESHRDVSAFISVQHDTDLVRVIAVAHSAEDMARIARHVGGRFDKQVDADSEWFDLQQSIPPNAWFVITALRDLVCERVVVATEEVEVEEPDPEAVAALPTVTRTETVETVEWRCHPILATDETRSAS